MKRKEKFPAVLLRERAYETVASVCYGEKFAFGDVDRKCPMAEDIRNSGVGRPIRLCIPETIKKIVNHGTKTEKLKQTVEAFFWKINPDDSMEVPFLPGGKEIAQRILSCGDLDSRSKAAAAILEVFVAGGNHEDIIPVLDAFDSINRVSEIMGSEFLRRSVFIAYNEPEFVQKFAGIMKGDYLLTCFRALKNKTIIIPGKTDRETGEGVEGLDNWFMKTASSSAFDTKDRNAVNEIALTALVVYGNMGMEPFYRFMDAVATISHFTRSGDHTYMGAAVCYKYANEGNVKKLGEFLDYIDIFKSEGEVEGTIGIISHCIKTFEKEGLSGKNEKDKPGEYIFSGVSLDMISDIDLDTELGLDKLEFEENTYPELEVDEELPGAVGELKSRIANIIGDIAAREFAEKARSAKEDRIDDFCDCYCRILDTIEEKMETFEKGHMKKEYSKLAGDLFLRMKNELPFAPLAYKVLGDWVDMDIQTADSFVSKIIPVRDNETLAGICRYYKP